MATQTPGDATDLAVRDGSGQGGDGVSLTEMQRYYVAEFVANGGNGSAAATAAGYSAPGQEAYRLNRLPHIQAAIRAEQLRLIGTEGLAVGVRTLLQVAGDLGAPAGARVQAAGKLVDRALGAVTALAPDKDQAGKPLTAQALAELRQGLAGDAAKLAELLGQAAGQAAAVVDLAPVAPEVAPHLPVGQRRK